ncbi:MAG: translation initiation factor IF-2 [Ruminococcaceae bacterium]|nr:translation initiation factor IF-2 [Oscillospiraceae bacterium]
MIAKQKISAIAKDINIPGKEIVKMLAEVAGITKSTAASLDVEEMSLVMEYYTQKFDDGTSIEEYVNAQQEKVEAEKKAKKEEAPAVEEAPAEEPAEVEISTKKTVRYVDTRTNAVDLDMQLAKEKAEELAPEMKDTETNKQRVKKNKNKQQPQKKNQPKQPEMPKPKKEEKPQPIHVIIPDTITVGELAQKLKVGATEIIKRLMQLGIMAAMNQEIEYDVAALIAEDMGAEVEREIIITAEDKLLSDAEAPDDEKDLLPRPPVVCVMGHVDHGKTSLLDAIRSTNVTASEAGGITQHIGAYMVKINDSPIAFLDTPGHEAFTAMRARGAMVTDIAILVVAADDGIMPQTIEAINHAKAAEVSVIVAINKIDKEGANPDRVKQELTEHGLVPEEWGGDVICVEVSAKQRKNIDSLLEMVLLTAEVKELKANPNRHARGTVIEAKLDKGRGPVATVLVQNGTLRQGDIIVTGTAVGRVRAMVDDKGKKIKEAIPSTPVEIVGLSETPDGGDPFYVVEDERAARAVVEMRKQKIKDEANKARQRVNLDDLFSQIQQGDVKDLNIIVKADVQGSVEAVRQSLEKLSNEEVRVRVIHGAVGAITESDVTLASASNAIIVGFNVRPDVGGRNAAELNKVDMRMYRVIYEAIEEIEAAMKGMLAPTFREAVIGHAEIRQTFKVSGVGTIGGCYVTDGKIQRNCSVRIVRDGIVIHEGELDSLKRFKDDAKEVASGYECGMGFVRFNDIKEGDVVECFIMEEVKR